MRKLIIVVAVLTVGLVAGGVAWASIPNSTTGVISGCYKNSNPAKGAVIVVDTQAGEACPNGYTPLSWNKQHVHHQWTREVSANTGPLAPDAGPEILALCPTGEIALGGGFRNRDPQNIAVTAAGDFLPIARFPQGYAVTVLAGPNGSQHDTGVTVSVTCGVSPD
jgi:hypothetical protein